MGSANESPKDRAKVRRETPALWEEGRLAVTTDGIRQQEMELKQQLEDIKSAQAGLTATQAGGMATMAASQAGLASSVVAGFVGLVVASSSASR